MKTVVFIDGENFMHQVRDMLYRRRLIRNRDELATYDIRSVLAQVFPQDVNAKQVKIYYYAAKIHLIDLNEELKERTGVIKAWNNRLKIELERQHIDFVEAGHLLVREGRRCVVCGHREPVLMEKGVDVQLATDLIRTSGDNVRLVLLSSDGDLMPAVVEAKRRGAKLDYIGFRGVSNAALSRAADARYTISSKQVEMVYRQHTKPTDQSDTSTAVEKASHSESNQAPPKHQHNYRRPRRTPKPSNSQNKTHDTKDTNG